jgi:hypothetical protein
MKKKVNEAAPAPVTPPPANGRSVARAIILVALVIHFGSLYLLYQDNESHGTLSIDAHYNTTGHYYDGASEATGFKLKPYAPLVLIALFIIYATNLYRHPFWDRWGYLLTLGLVLFGAMGGALVRTPGGKLSLFTFGLLCLATFIHRQARTQPAAGPA